MADFVKKPDLQFVSQLNTFRTKLPSYMTLFGIDQATVDAATEDAQFFAFMVTGVTTARGYSKSWVEQKDILRDQPEDAPVTIFPIPVNVTTPPTIVAPGVERRFRALAKQIKSNPNYTQAIGEDLGIVSITPVTELTPPKLTVVMSGGKPNIKYKRGISEGLRIYSKRGDETTFTFLDVSTRSPYVDARPNLTPNVAETRQYYAYYILDDAQVGDQSATVSISMA